MSTTVDSNSKISLQCTEQEGGKEKAEPTEHFSGPKQIQQPLELSLNSLKLD